LKNTPKCIVIPRLVNGFMSINQTIFEEVGDYPNVTLSSHHTPSRKLWLLSTN
jgi:hypothetical protein